MRRLLALMRNWIAGNEVSRWHYDDASDRMRRFIDGRWETRDPTEDEIDDAVSARVW